MDTKFFFEAMAHAGLRTVILDETSFGGAMTKLDKIVDDLRAEASTALERAHGYLGARPGPGIDIIVLQLSDRSWKAEGRTPCGRAFILKLYGGDRYGADNQHKLVEFRRRVVEWGLTFDIKWELQPKVEDL